MNHVLRDLDRRFVGFGVVVLGERDSLDSSLSTEAGDGVKYRHVAGTDLTEDELDQR